jgi:CDP-glucose 4,6-dehydratase
VAAGPQAAQWRGRRVLVTGHTGFVGGWLCAWLDLLGAEICGYALAPPTEPSFFATTGLQARIARHLVADVNDAPRLAAAVADFAPDVVFHLAAQPLVRHAHREPVATFATNVGGTVNLLEACRHRPGIRRVVVYTTDKVYRNDQSGRAFAEDGRLGGDEPYSASKAAAEMAVAAYWESYFRRDPRLATVSVVRAGNIIGGGDWAAERLFPDAMRAFAAGRALVLRQPDATRPWQHVLDAVRGTLLLAERDEPRGAPAEAIAWNFGPAAGAVHPVAAVADAAAAAWGEGAAWREERDARIPEARALVLSSARAARELGWQCRWDLQRAVQASTAWYRAALRGQDMLAFTRAQIEAHAA